MKISHCYYKNTTIKISLNKWWTNLVCCKEHVTVKVNNWKYNCYQFLCVLELLSSTRKVLKISSDFVLTIIRRSVNKPKRIAFTLTLWPAGIHCHAGAPPAHPSPPVACHRGCMSCTLGNARVVWPGPRVIQSSPWTFGSRMAVYYSWYTWNICF